MHTIFVDADGCPVKDEVYRVAGRYGLRVTLVANSSFFVPREDWIELIVVGDDLDAADDWIVEAACENDVVITADLPLAGRCLSKGAHVLGPKGRVFTQSSIGGILADREIRAQLREQGIMTGGPAPFTRRDRSRFLQELDTVVNRALRGEQSL